MLGNNKKEARMAYAPAYPHDPIAQIRDDVFIARGSIKMNPLVRITRNMVILRHNGELTLVDPIRLNDDGESQLKALGEVKRILRLGPMHGIDDPWYVDKFGAQLWAQPGGTTYTTPPIDVAVDAATELPFPGASLFEFNGTVQPEAALLLADGLLITCDAIQHYGDYSNNNWVARQMMPRIGFPMTTIVGPVWLKLMTPEGGNLRSEFERLAQLPFDALFAAHGTLLESGANNAVRTAISKAFDAV